MFYTWLWKDATFQLYYLEESEALAKLINYTLTDAPGVWEQEE